MTPEQAALKAEYLAAARRGNEKRPAYPDDAAATERIRAEALRASGLGNGREWGEK